MRRLGWASDGTAKTAFSSSTGRADWLDFYQDNGFVVHDVLPIEARRRVRPFWYGDVVSRLKLSAKQKELYEAGVAYGWKDVFGVPIHGPGSLQGLVTMATRQELKLSLADCAVLEAMARAVWERCRTAEGFGMCDRALCAAQPARDRVPAMGGGREVGCRYRRRWSASSRQRRISISSGRRNDFGVRTRVEAVAVGVLRGVI